MKIKTLFAVLLAALMAVILIFGATSCEPEHEHSFSEWQTASEPTCTAFGINKRACECGKTEYETVAALPHTPVTDAAVGATCTTLGKTEGSHCSACNTVITAQADVAMLPHVFSEWKSFIAPTCTAFGLNERACECGQTEYATVAATAHTPVTDPAVGATCTTPGFTEGSLIKRIKSLIPILIPLFASVFRRAFELATAMTCRCYRGGEGRTRMTKMRLRARDVVVLIFAIAVLGGAVSCNYWGIGYTL